MKRLLTILIGCFSFSLFAAGLVNGTLSPVPNSGGGSGGVTTNQVFNLFLQQNLYVAQTGNDANAGTNWSTALATLTNAVQLLSGSGGTITISNGYYYVPTGNYFTNSNVKIVVQGAPNSLVSLDQRETTITNWAQIGTTGIWTNQLSSVDATNLLNIIAHGNDEGTGARRWIFEAGVPYGNLTNNQANPSQWGCNANMFDVTNVNNSFRLQYFPLQYTYSITNMTNGANWASYVTNNFGKGTIMGDWLGVLGTGTPHTTNGTFYLDANNILYVREATNGPMTGVSVIVPSASQNLFSENGGSGSLELQNLQCYFGYRGVSLNGLTSVKASSCYFMGYVDPAFSTDGQMVKQLEIDNCEVAGCWAMLAARGNVYLVTQTNQSEPYAKIVNSYSHDEQDCDVVARGNAHRKLLAVWPCERWRGS
jgi:hypothetical protein